jgi:opacity protein-like surface antigen
MKTHRTGTASAVTGFLTATAVVLLVIVATAAAAPHVAPVNIDPPTITGTARVGELLTAQDGTWDNSPTEFRYRWLRCNRGGNSCALLAADGKTYRVAQADVGSTLRVRVTAVNADGSTNARSEQTEVVGSNAEPLTNTARPTITGEARVGQELTASEGSWTGSPTSFAFQWQRCNIDAITCLDVAGATGRTYGVRLADLGFRLRVQVVARKDERSGMATSLPTAVVQPTTPVTNKRPTLRILKVTFLGAKVYVRFRVCDDTATNLGILVRETRPGVRPALRRFATRVPPRPCGAYTRSWLPAQRFRGPGRYTITLRARDVSGLTSAPAVRTFRR